MTTYFNGLRRFVAAVREHRQVEEQVNEGFQETLALRYRKDPPSPVRIFAYAQKNFFSSLFLSIYAALGVAPQRRLLYGTINHCLRGIVTGTDNLLDNEYKEMLPLRFAAGADRFKSVMHILIFDRILFGAVDKAVATGLVPATARQRILDALFDALVPIGAAEATEEGGIAVILRPAEILSSVHMFKGGRLLCLAFVAPLLLEERLRPRLETAAAGIYSIGLALQVIDDITDFYDDIRDKRHNYLVSSIHHEGDGDEILRLGEICAGAGVGEPVEGLFSASLRRVMARAIGEAIDGFDRLRQAGYWMEPSQALLLVRFLFRLRGVVRLLDFFPEPAAMSSLLDRDAS